MLPETQSNSNEISLHYRLQACTAQHIGGRTDQQDRVLIYPNPRDKRAVLFVVADGMGGKTGGALAAQQVITTAQNLFNNFHPDRDEPEELLRQIAQEAHVIIKLTAFSSEKEPHSTMIALIVQPDRVDWAHAGDSRLYHFRQEKFVHRTTDHSFAENVARGQQATHNDPRLHRMSNAITSALGAKVDPEVTFKHSGLPHPGDHFLLCSDGLWGRLSTNELGNTINQYSAREAAEILINTAIERAHNKGDNCSLVLVKLLPPA